MIETPIGNSTELFDFRKIVKMRRYVSEGKHLKLVHSLLSLEKDPKTDHDSFSTTIKSLYFSIIGNQDSKNLVMWLYSLFGTKYNLQNPHHPEKCYTDNKENLKAISAEEIITNNAKTQPYQSNICNITVQEFNTIPHIMHHVWITTTARSNEDQKDYFLKNHAFLQNNIEHTEGWQHIIWMLDPISTTLDLANEIEKLGYQLRFVSELANDPQSAYLINAAKVFGEFGYFALASNILRFVALREMGGVYMDGDYELFHSMNDWIDNVRSLTGMQAEGVTCSAIIAAEKNHHLLDNAYNVLIRNIEGKGPDYTKYPCVKNDKMVLLTDIVLSFVYFLDRELKEEDGDFRFPPGFISPFIFTDKNGANHKIDNYDPTNSCSSYATFFKEHIGVIGEHHAGNSYAADKGELLSHNMDGIYW